MTEFFGGKRIFIDKLNEKSREASACECWKREASACETRGGVCVCVFEKRGVDVCVCLKREASACEKKKSRPGARTR